MPVTPRVLHGPEEIGAEIAALIVDRYRRRYPGHAFLLGCPGGRSLSTAYAHASSILVGVGQSVAQGQTVSLVGSTGHSTGPHLHFEVRVNGVAGDPLLYL